LIVVGTKDLPEGGALPTDNIIAITGGKIMPAIRGDLRLGIKKNIYVFNGLNII
jgi:hypothetical protein